MESNTEHLMDELRRIIKLRSQQMESAALCRDAGEIDSLDWDGYAARYAAAVREYRVLQHLHGMKQPALTETRRGGTWVQG